MEPCRGQRPRGEHGGSELGLQLKLQLRAHRYAIGPCVVQVVVFLGELDCREYLAGLAPEALLVSKANELVGMLLALARRLIEHRRVHVVLHPVPPLLPHSARAVELFNMLLCMAVRGSLGAAVRDVYSGSAAAARRCKPTLLMSAS